MIAKFLLFKERLIFKELSNEVSRILDEISDKGDINSSYNKCTSLENQFKFELKEVDKTERFYSENTVCPTCKQDIDEDSVSGLVKENLERKEQLDEAMKMLVEEMDKHTNRLEEISKKQNVLFLYIL